MFRAMIDDRRRHRRSRQQSRQHARPVIYARKGPTSIQPWIISSTHPRSASFLYRVSHHKTLTQSITSIFTLDFASAGRPAATEWGRTSNGLENVHRKCGINRMDGWWYWCSVVEENAYERYFVRKVKWGTNMSIVKQHTALAYRQWTNILCAWIEGQYASSILGTSGSCKRLLGQTWLRTYEYHISSNGRELRFDA